MRIGKTGAVVAMALIAAGLAVAADAPKKAEPKKPELNAGGPPPTQEEMMAAWQKSAAVGPEHAVLKNFEGKWTSSVTATMDPSKPPEKSEGTSEGMVILGGRFVHVLHHGTMMGQPFEGMMLLGYDNIRKKYTSSWVDSMGTQIASYDGTWNAAKKSLTMAGHFLDPMTGKPMKTRGVTAFPDATTMTYDEYMMGPDGKEMKTLHIDFKKS
jgi:uncharacterized protein DUF1579